MTNTFTYVYVENIQSCHSHRDCIYVFRFNILWAHSFSIRLASFSDHHLVTITILLRPKQLGLAFLYFNNSVLEDVGFLVSFQEFWLAWQRQRHTFPSAQQ